MELRNPLMPEYSTKKLCADLAALLDVLELKSAVCMKMIMIGRLDSMLIFFIQVVIGHDWGSFIVGRFALWHPDRISALAM